MPSCNLKLQLCTHCRDMCVKCVHRLRYLGSSVSSLSPFNIILFDWQWMKINARAMHHCQFEHYIEVNSDHCNMLLTKRTCLCRRRIICYDKTIEYEYEKREKITSKNNQMKWKIKRPMASNIAYCYRSHCEFSIPSCEFDLVFHLIITKYNIGWF